MKNQVQKANMFLRLENRAGFGVLNVLVIMAIIITITAGIASISGIMSKNTKALQEETKLKLQCQSVFAYADVAVEAEIQRIFNEAMKQSMEQIQKEEDIKKSSDEESNHLNNEENNKNEDIKLNKAKSNMESAQNTSQQVDKPIEKTEENQSGEGDATITSQDEKFREKFGKVFLDEISKLQASGKIISLEEMFYLNEDQIRQITEAKYISHKIALYQFQENINSYKSAKGQALGSLSDLAINIDIEFRPENGGNKVFQKSYYLNIDPYISRETAFEPKEAVIRGREVFYKS